MLCMNKLTIGLSAAARYVEDLFENVDKIDLLKIDVDDRASYEAVFAGVRAVLHKTEIVQVEMIEAEIGRSGMLWIMGIMQSHNFLMFGLEDVETFPGFRHGSLGHDCVNSTLPIRMHSEAVSRPACLVASFPSFCLLKACRSTHDTSITITSKELCMPSPIESK